MTIEVEQCAVCKLPIMGDSQSTRLDNDEYAHKKCMDDQDGKIWPQMTMADYVLKECKEQRVEWAGRIIASRQLYDGIPINDLLTCALYMLGRYEKSYRLLPIQLICSGEAHSNPHIDHCSVCMPYWGNYPVCPGCKSKLYKYGNKGGLQCKSCNVIFTGKEK